MPGGDLKGDLIGIERNPTDGTILAAFKRATKVNRFTANLLTVATPPTQQTVSTGSTYRLGR